MYLRLYSIMEMRCNGTESNATELNATESDATESNTSTTDNYRSTYREYWSLEVGRRAAEAACPRDQRGIDGVRKNEVLPNVAHPDRRYPLQNREHLKVGSVQNHAMTTIEWRTPRGKQPNYRGIP